MSRIFRLNKLLISAILIISVFTIPEISHSFSSNLSTETELKAAYLYNFLKFIDWDENLDQVISDGIYITIVGDWALYEAFEPVKEKTVKGRKLVITYLNELDKVQPAHLIYISPSIMKELGVLPDYLTQSGALTVGEGPRFSKAGGIIGFIRSSDRIRFTISKSAVQKANLTISSKLMKLGILIN